jgi:hypothetical protein
MTTSRLIRNRIIILLNRAGLATGPIHLLTVAGRRTGRLHTIPVAPVVVDGVRYLIEAYPGSDWVRNAHAAGCGVLTRGHLAEPVDLVPLGPDDAVSVLRSFPVQNPRGVEAFVRNGLVTAGTPEAFAEAAGRCPVFRATPRR